MLYLIRNKKENYIIQLQNVHPRFIKYLEIMYRQSFYDENNVLIKHNHDICN